jgi:hypothetical protein
MEQEITNEEYEKMMKKVEETSINEDPMEANLCDSCQ